MKERPILFSAPMVRAILDGRKTQTRRVVRWKGLAEGLNLQFTGLSVTQRREGWVLDSMSSSCHEERSAPTRCPYGEVGDRLWVRETFMVEPHPSEVGLTRENLPRTWDAAVAAAGTVHYAADPGSEIVADGRRWSPSIHMPRSACRLVLELVSVRVERLHAISEPDCAAEGVERDTEPCDHTRRSCADVGCLGQTFRSSFADLWERINGAASWAANPWVWVIEFKRVEDARG